MYNGTMIKKTHNIEGNRKMEMKKFRKNGVRKEISVKDREIVITRETPCETSVSGVKHQLQRKTYPTKRMAKEQFHNMISRAANGGWDFI